MDEACACDVLSWEACPECGGLAAVGREMTRDGVVVDFCCMAGCAVPVEQVQRASRAH